jgi:hypothetical protein
MGLDIDYAMMGGDLDLDVSYNTASGWGDEDDEDMMSIGATYNVNDDMSVSATRTTYGDGGFDMDGSNVGGWASHGNMGHLGANQKDLAIGGSYSMGDFNLGVTMHTVSDESEGAEDYERSAMEVSLGYTMSANSGLSINYATDNNGGDTDTKYTWITLTVTP